MQTAVVTVPNYNLSPVTLQEVKNHLKMDSPNFDDQLELIRLGAIEEFAAESGLALAPQVQDIFFDRLPGETLHPQQQWPWRDCEYYALPFYPVNSIASFKYTDSGATVTTWSTANYILNSAVKPCRVYRSYGVSWPSFIKYPVNPISIRVQCGYTDNNPSTNGPAIPNDIKNAILLMCEHRFRNSSAVEIGVTPTFATVVPKSYSAILERYRIGNQGAIYEQ